MALKLAGQDAKIDKLVADVTALIAERRIVGGPASSGDAKHQKPGDNLSPLQRATIYGLGNGPQLRRKP